MEQMLNELLTILVKVLASVITMVLIYLGAKVKTYIALKVGDQQLAQIELLIQEFCEAAEQQFKVDDPDGSIRYNYVIGLLQEAGYQITDIIRAKIESAVFSINVTGGVSNERSTKVLNE